MPKARRFVRGGALYSAVLVLLLTGGCATDGNTLFGSPLTFRPLPKAKARVSTLEKVRLPDASQASQSQGAAFSEAEPSMWPVEHPEREVISRFGWRSTRSGGPGRMHKGIDIKAPKDSPVRSVAPGIVKEVSQNAGYGQYVVVEHGGSLETCYAHLSRILVEEGEAVGPGDVVGLLGATGNATTPHVHFEVRSAGKPVDPWLYLPADH